VCGVPRVTRRGLARADAYGSQPKRSKLPNLSWTRACYGAEPRHRHVGERIAIAAAVIAVAIERVLRVDVVDRFRPEDRVIFRAFD